MIDGLTRAQNLAKKARDAYARLKATAEARVARWQWATFALHAPYDPAYFEISKYHKGRPLAREPIPPKDGAHGYGFDAEGRLVVERVHTEFPGQFYETFFVHEGDGIASFYYSHEPTKPWLNIAWRVTGVPGVVERHTIFANGNTHSTTYEYDNGLVSRCRRRGTNHPYPDFDDTFEIEHDGTGQIVRVFWCHSDGRRELHFERPEKPATLAACRGQLLRELTAATVETLALRKVDDEVYALIFSYSDGECNSRLPPHMGIGLTSERTRFRSEYGTDALNFIWNPAEWSIGEIHLHLSPALARLCASVSQDIWQNELDEEVNAFLVDLARSVQKAQLPMRLADHFLVLAIAVDGEDIAAQVAAQVGPRMARTLRRAGLL